MVLIEGEYTEEETVRVLAMGHPPSEKRDVARGLHGHVDFLGGGAVSLKEEVRESQVPADQSKSTFLQSWRTPRSHSWSFQTSGSTIRERWSPSDRCSRATPKQENSDPWCLFYAATSVNEDGKAKAD